MNRYLALTAACLLLFTYALTASAAEPANVVDRVLQRDGQTTQYLSFCGVKDGLVGHAFLVLSEDDPQQMVCRTVVAVGFYPKPGIKNSLLGVMEKAPGKIKDDAETLKQLPLDAHACRLTVPLTPEEFALLQIKLAAYEKSDYTLIAQDCVTLCEETAKSILKLKTPDREKLFKQFKQDVKQAIQGGANGTEAAALESFPARYIEALAELNQGK